MIFDIRQGRVYQPPAAWRLNVIGTPGMGKSHLRNWLLPRFYRLTLWNPMGDFNVGEEAITVDDYVRRAERYRTGSFQVTVEPSGAGEDLRIAEYDKLCRAVYDVGAQHFASEEIALVSSPNSVPDGLDELCIRGRHRAVSLSFYGQRFHQFPVIVRGTASEICAFRQTDPIDVKDFYQRVAPSETPVPLNELLEHEFLHWTPQSGVTGPWKLQGSEIVGGQSRPSFRGVETDA